MFRDQRLISVVSLDNRLWQHRLSGLFFVYIAHIWHFALLISRVIMTICILLARGSVYPRNNLSATMLIRRCELLIIFLIAY